MAGGGGGGGGRVEITEARPPQAPTFELQAALPRARGGESFREICRLSFALLTRRTGCCLALCLADFPESEKLTLFIANMWHDVFISPSAINQAMQLVARQRARGEVLNCLRAFLSWEKVRLPRVSRDAASRCRTGVGMCSDARR